jgi:hypothetical protein
MRPVDIPVSTILQVWQRCDGELQTYLLDQAESHVSQ